MLLSILTGRTGKHNHLERGITINGAADDAVDWGFENRLAHIDKQGVVWRGGLG